MNTPPTLAEIDESARTRCEVWTRVMGYHRPVSQFNRGKQSEHRERRHFREHPSVIVPVTRPVPAAVDAAQAA
jgi:hypothetical protein